MLLDKKDVLKVLCCPKTGSTLNRINNTMISETGTSYNIINNTPVLIDFSSSTINECDTNNMNSAVDRQTYSSFMRIIKKLMSTPKNITSNNIRYIENTLPKNSNKVLIVGGGSIGQGIGSLYSNPDLNIISFDVYESPNIQFIADAHNIPIQNDYFDAVIVQAVLEHVLEPNTVVSEIHRVLKTNGIVYAETPFLQHVHEGAYDFTRFTESGHRYLFKEFEMIKSGCYSGAGTQLLWSLDNFSRGLFRSKKAGNITRLLFFWLQYVDKIIPEPYNIDAASAVFFLGKKNKKCLTPLCIIDHYQGAQK